MAILIESVNYRSHRGASPDARLVTKNPEKETNLVAAFKTDLESPRPRQEIDGVRSSMLDHVKDEQNRLIKRSGETENGRKFDQEDIIVGDAPYQTPFDALKGPYTLIEPEIAAEALTQRFYNLWILNHPARIDSLKRTIAQGYHPPSDKEIPVIDEAIQRRIALDFDDLGYDVAGLASMGNDEANDGARSILANGPFTYVADNLVAIPYILSSMPDVSNAMSIATHALSGGLSFVPFDSIWGDRNSKMKVANRAREILLNDPVLQNHEDREFLKDYYQRLIGITIKANPRSVDEILEFVRNGYTTFRIYDARSRDSRMIETFAKAVEALQASEFENIRDRCTFIVGQLVQSDTANALQDIADSVDGIGLGGVVGIGGGGICSTPKEAGILTGNVNVGREILRKHFEYPLLFDGGIGDRMPILFGIGGSGGFKSQALVGGCIEQPPGMWYVDLSEGDEQLFAKNYSGEAAERTKHGGTKIDFLGRPLFVEGADQYVVFNKRTATMTENTYSLLQSLATAMVFARAEKIQDYREWRNPPIGTQTDQAKRRASVHHTNGRR